MEIKLRANNWKTRMIKLRVISSWCVARFGSICAIWKRENFAKSKLLHGCFSRVLNFKNAAKSHKASTLLTLLLIRTTYSYLLAKHWERQLNWYDHTDVASCGELFRFHRRDSVLLNKTYTNQNVEEVPESIRELRAIHRNNGYHVEIDYWS